MSVFRKFGLLAISILFVSVVQSSAAHAQNITIDLNSLGGPICSFNRYNRSGGDERRWVQGFAATEKYCVFGYVNSDSSYSHIIVQNRSNGAIVSDQSVGWGHLNTLHYDWQNNQIWVEGGGCLNGTTVAIEPCRVAGPRGYYYDGSLTGQGRDAVNNVGFMTMSDNNNNNLARIWICPATSDCSSPQHIITINNFGAGEIEDISFDKNGDVLISFNRWHQAYATAEVYRINKSVFANLGINTVPTGSASTINADGSTGGGAAPGGGGSGSGGGAQDPGGSGSGGGAQDPGGSGSGGAPGGGGGSGGAPGGGSASGSSEGDDEFELTPPPEGECASILTWMCNGSGDDIVGIIRLVINILTAGIVVAGTIGMIFCGYIVLTARENEAQVAKAKKRLLEIVIGLVLWVLAATLVQFFLPGADTTGLATATLNMML